MPLDSNRSVLPHLDLIPVNHSTWHTNIADFDEVSRYQLANYETAKGPGRIVEPVLFSRAGEIVGGALMVIRPMPFLGKLASTHWGPILRRRDTDAPTVRAAMIDALAKEYGDRRRMMVTVWTPPVCDGDPDDQGLALERGFRSSRSWPDPYVHVLDLAQTEAQMRQNLAGKWRHHLKKAEQSGLTFEVAGADGLPEMDRLYAEMLARKGFDDRSAYHTLEAMMKTEEQSLRPRLFFVRQGETAVVGAVVLTAGTQAHYLYGATADAALPVNAGHFMQWSVAMWLKANTRAQWYNLGATDGVEGLRIFKSGFTGKSAKPVFVPTSIDYAARPVVAFAGRTMFKLRDALRDRAVLGKSANNPATPKPA
ncbi:hypothetical protein GCM10007989_03280 [Devosia pacifica]|uniref:BioF2-like acetyltransferase domain-containing protein n=1 Tax=Devosia pacifica TaxID=1335967 RepID=A0A918RW14_9HYPH|nr:GNAT family N-acetyltransferase [Devosia pacifica]GHA12189.1 hypothetical protein GCM10007989_03280 [Devosia pacifica]